MTDDEALKYAEEFQIPMPGKDLEGGNVEQDPIQQQLQQTLDEAKTPKSAAKKATGKRKSAAPGEVEPAKGGAAAASPDKKRKRTSKVTEEKEPEPKKSGRKKAKSG